MQSETIGKLAAALAKAQGQMGAAIKDSKNPFFKSNYADLASVWDACRTPLSENGLAVIQTISHDSDPAANAIEIVSTLAHESGEWIKSTLSITPKDRSPQAAGSAITYGRRYGLSALVGVCPDDDDGEGAMGRGKPQRQNQPMHPRMEPLKAGNRTIDLNKYLSVKELEEAWGELSKAEQSDKSIIQAFGTRKKQLVQ